MNKHISVYDNTISARTYIGYIAEQAGCFAVIGRDGKLYFKKIGENTVELSLKYFQNFKWGEKFKISRVRYEDGIRLFEEGNTTHNTVYINQDNMFIVDQEQINNIYNETNGLEVYGFEGESIIDPSLDIGDLILIEDKSIIYQGTMQFTGKWKASISSKIQAKTKEETMTRTPSQKTINRRIQSQIDQENLTIGQLVKQTSEHETLLTQHTQDIKGISDTVSKSTTLSATLTSESINIPTDENGNNGDYSNCKTTIKILYGSEDVTSQSTIEITKSSGVTGKYSNNTYTVSNLTEDTGYVDFKATYKTIVLNKRFNLLKAKKGNKGDKGDIGIQGIQGLQGEKGEQGIPGPKGETGEPGPKGENGAEGASGKDGVDGKTTYFHIKYSAVSNPTSASQISENPNTYIGTYVDFTEADSSDPTKYNWSQFKGSQGDKGEQGIPGINGENGKTSYLHIAYATSSDGTSGFSVTDSTNKTYIGQYTDFIQDDSTDPTKYLWTKIQADVPPSYKVDSGKNLTLEDCGAFKLKSLKLSGESKQDNRSGKNKLAYPYVDTTKTTNGITYTDNGDGTIKVNGTATANATFNLVTNYELSAGTYKLVGEDENYTNTAIRGSYKVDGTTRYVSTAAANFTIPEGATNITFYLVILSEKTVSNITLKPMLLLATETNTTYELPGLMPSQAFPSEVQTVTGKQNITSCGGNRHKGLSIPKTDTNYWQNAHAYFTPLEEGWGKFDFDNTERTSTAFINAGVKKDAIKLKPNTLYTFVVEIRNSNISENSGAFLQIVSANASTCFNTAKSIGYVNLNTGGIYKLTSTTKDNLDTTSIIYSADTYLRLAAGTKGTVEARISLFEGDYDISNFQYKPYQGQTYNFTLADEYCSLLKEEIDTIKNVNGIWKRKQIVGKQIFDGTENFTYYNQFHADGNEYHCYQIPISLSDVGVGYSICTHFKNKTSCFMANIGTLGDFCDHPTLNRKYFISDKPTVEEFKASLAEQKAAGTPVILYYKLATPTYTDIEDTDLLNFLNNISTYEGITNIFSTSENGLTFDFDVEYWTNFKGGTGSDGRNIASITPQYYVSTSKTELTGGEWSESTPIWSEGKYIWTREAIHWESPEETTYTAEIYDSSWDNAGDANKTAEKANATSEKNSVDINNNYQELTSKLNDCATAESVKTVENKVETLQTSTQYYIGVTEDIKENGVSKIKTEKGFTFDDDGLTIDETNSKTKSNLDTDGLEVLDKTSGTNETLLKAGYDEELGETIVKSKNMTVEKYLTIGKNSRFEDYVNPVLGGKGTGAFSI